MSLFPAGFYAEWRRRAVPPLPCRESSDPPPERWLQQVWRHQRLRRDRLVTRDGRTVRVLHPGFWNREAGPDFRQAVLQFGEEPAVTGDIELDLAAAGWRGHRHAGNPAYRQVILQVVWEGGPQPGNPPVLELKPFLDAPWDELVSWLENEARSLLPPGTLGRCCAPLREVSDAAVAGLLEEAARDRLHRKAADLHIRARHAGWDQALQEGLFTALGYKHNGWPMRRLAELAAGLPPAEPVVWEARLLGLAGLLPDQPPGSATGAAQVKRLWDSWWRERDRWADVILPGAVWRRSGIRPANHPQRRLALAARWCAGGNLPARLQTWLLTDSPPRRNPAGPLLELLEPPEESDGFWARHWTLRSVPSDGIRPFLGRGRLTDLAVNVVLPWLLARARTDHDDALVRRVEQRYFGWPAGQDNALLRHARSRLFGGPSRRLPRTAAAQQGLLQIIRDFCEPAGPLCSDCRFPALVASLRPAGAEPAG